MNYSISEIIWYIMKWILEGMSRERALLKAAGEFKIDIEKLRRHFS